MEKIFGKFSLPSGSGQEDFPNLRKREPSINIIVILSRLKTGSIRSEIYRNS